MDAVTVLSILLFVLLVIDAPMGFAIGDTTMISTLSFSDLNIVVNVQYCYSGIFLSTVMVIPCFMLAGAIMSIDGIAWRIINFTSTLTDFATGTLECVSMLICMLLGVLTGSGMTTASAVDGIMIPRMKYKGCDSSYAATLVCFGGIVRPVTPPSLSLVLYGALARTSVPDLFRVGTIPGVMIGLVLLMVDIIICKRTGIEVHRPELGPGGERIPMIQFWKERLYRVGKATKDRFWALFPPSIILSGIYSGFLTPTKAVTVSVVYSTIVSLFVHRDMTQRDLYKTFMSVAVLNGAIPFLLGTSTVLPTFTTFEQVLQMVTNFMTGLSDSPVVLLLVINVFLLIMGCFLDTTPAIVIIAPTLLPTIQAFDISPVYLGIITSVNLAVGLYTPPYDYSPFVGTAAARIKMESMLK